MEQCAVPRPEPAVSSWHRAMHPILPPQDSSVGAAGGGRYMQGGAVPGVFTLSGCAAPAGWWDTMGRRGCVLPTPPGFAARRLAVCRQGSVSLAPPSLVVGTRLFLPDPSMCSTLCLRPPAVLGMVGWRLRLSSVPCGLGTSPGGTRSPCYGERKGADG